jgi:type II secretory pathway pseudopilin PulG
MREARQTRQRKKPSEEGYVLLFAIFFLAILVLSLAAAAPRVAKSIQRDREVETFHRGRQYRRAIQLYYRSFKAYPPNVDALVKTNNIRFLRKRYIDPMTGKDDWKPILFGQNKTPTAMGFFGQPLAGGATSIVGTGPGGGNSAAGTSSGTGSAFGGSSFGGSAFGGSSFGGSSAGGSAFGGGSTGGSSIFSSSNNGNGQTPSSGASGTTGGSGSSGTSAAGTAGSSSSTTGSSSSSSSTTSSNGQTFGGAGIIGYEPASPNQSILIYKKKNHYNEWEFTYDPISDVQTMGGGNTGAIGQPAGSTTTPVGSSPFGGPVAGTGQGTGTGAGSGTGSGLGSSSGSNPSQTTPTVPPGTSAPQ